jgi:hypothetical protein
MSYRFTARSGFDDEVHLLNAPLDAVVCPMAYTTWCGRPVVEIYRDGRAVTCTGCVRAAGGTAAPNSSCASLPTAEHVS